MNFQTSESVRPISDITNRPPPDFQLTIASKIAAMKLKKENQLKQLLTSGGQTQSENLPIQANLKPASETQNKGLYSKAV